MHYTTTNPLSKPELRKFGLLFGGILILLFGISLPYLLNKSAPTWPFATALAMWTFAIIAPSQLKLIYQLWIKIGAILSFINTRIILSVLFFGLFLPIALMMRLIKHDPMTRKFNPLLTSYRISTKPISKQDFERPF